MKTAAIATVAALMTATTAAADEFTPLIRDYFENSVRDWAQSDILVRAISDQNSRTMSYDQARIDELDLAWRAEIGSGSTPTITPVLENAAADFLRQQVAQSDGRITEIFIMDAQGLNVAASGVTSDFWQGDEAKFSMTHGIGPGAIHISDVELDESTQRYQGQLSFTVVDPDSGQPIGAITIGVDAEALM